MAELADALDLGSSTLCVGVRVPPLAPLSELSGNRLMKLSILTKILRCTICLFFIIGLFNLSALAQEEDLSQLQQKIAELELRVKELEGFLKASKELQQNASILKFGWQNTKNWRDLKIGMNESRVKEMLGQPVKIIKGVKTLWYYPNIYCGYCSFDENGNLIGWNEP